MSIVVHSFDQPDRFVSGTVGPPGQRTFFLQAKEGNRVTSVALEKQQVSILAERVDLLLDQALRESGGEATIPAMAPAGSHDGDPLDQPIVEEFRVGTITLSWEGTSNLVVIELFPMSEEAVVSESVTADDEDAEAAPEVDLAIEVEASEVLIVKMEPAYARAFVRRSQSVVSAGRPACQFCGGPMDPEGHVCPRANGFRRIAH